VTGQAETPEALPQHLDVIRKGGFGALAPDAAKIIGDTAGDQTEAAARRQALLSTLLRESRVNVPNLDLPPDMSLENIRKISPPRFSLLDQGPDPTAKPVARFGTNMVKGELPMDSPPLGNLTDSNARIMAIYGFARRLADAKSGKPVAPMDPKDLEALKGMSLDEINAIIKQMPGG
jgi:hypothetical protein